MEKNIKTYQKDLLGNENYKELLNIEAAYAAAVKGGHSPYYFEEEKQQRLVSNVNLLSSKERTDIVFTYFIGKN